MKIPPDPPSLAEVIQKEGADLLFEKIDRPDVREVLQKSINEYPYWDHFRYWPAPKDVSPELLWIMRDFISSGRRIQLPLQDKRGAAFSFWLPDRCQEWLHRIDRNVANPLMTDDRPLSPQTRDRVIVSSLMEEAIASSQIEGAATTRRIAKEMLRTGRKPVDRSEQMIVNNYRAIERIRELKAEPLAEEILRELHVILATGTMDPGEIGRFRRSPEDDDVKVFESDRTVLHDPPPGKDLPLRIARLQEFANAETHRPFIHPVVKAIILHFWVGFDHPFIDGNGRVARAIFYWYLLRQKYWLFEYLSISRIVLRTSGQYKMAFLYSERPGNDLTYFLMYNLRVIDLALQEIRRLIAKKREELDQAAFLLRKLPALNRRQREVLFDALSRPRQYTIEEHRQIHQVSYQTARTDLLGLTKQGFLELIKSGKTFVFLPAPDLEDKIKAAER